MRAAPALALGALGSLILSCGDDTAPPRSQWRVALVTDAPVPHFGDRIVVEVTDAAGALACESCRRQIAVSETTAWPVTFGIVPSGAGQVLVLRARLFRTDHSGATGLPTSSAAIDALGTLPTPVANEITDVGLVLSAACFGTASDPIARTTCNPNTTEAEPAKELAALSAATAKDVRPGAWAPAISQPCAGAAVPPADMRCLSSGVFLLGDETFVRRGIGFDPVPERLVQLAPFLIDVDELSVGTFRELVKKGALSEDRVLSTLENEECTYFARDDSRNDAFPMTCINHADAEAACAALGKRLPTEAEWEYAAGGITESRFPWGVDEDICGHAIIGRARSNFHEGAEPGIDLSTLCRVPAAGPLIPHGVIARGNDKDLTKEGLRNMGGNVGEWVADAYAPHATGCLGKPRGLHVNPRCEPTSPDAEPQTFAVKGGRWTDFPTSASPAARYSEVGTATRIDIGFRCAK